MNPATAHQPFVFSAAATSASPVGVAPIVSPGAGDPLVNDTRREISEIVREVALAARSDRSTQDFFRLLVDRVLRAMAAEGVIIWHRNGDHANADFLPLHSLGRLTHHTIEPQSTAAHLRMLLEIASEKQPVVVPATPGAIDPDVPANPTAVPVAVVPIESDPGANHVEYLIEVFLEPEGGVATQRGYLRFVAQMADLAGEFLRSEQLRQLRRLRQLSRRVDQSIARIHQPTDRRKVEAAIVDTAAELFGFDRVGLCRIDTRKPTLLAVSHVNKIDTRSSGARQLCDAATTPLTDGIGLIFASDRDDELANALNQDGSDDAPIVTSDILLPDSDDPIAGVVLASDQANDPIRIVALASDHDAIEQLVTENQIELQRFANHAQLALRHASRLNAIPGGRFLTALAPADGSRRRHVWARPLITTAVLTLLIIAAMFPAPMYIHAPATIRPSDVQRLTAPRDAVVQQIHVDHGQVVAANDPLITLWDVELEQQITTLVGRRAVLMQKQSHWNERLVDASSNRREQNEQLQGEQILVQEEISSIDNQLTQLRQSKAALVIRADRDGVVDAWRLAERLSGRPLARGDSLLQVVAHDSPWVVDVRVPQNRIDHVQRAVKSETLETDVALDANPQQRWLASFVAVGPAVASPSDGLTATSVRLQLSDEAVRVLQENHQGPQHADAPARALFYCGRKPAAYLLLQDVIRSTRSTLSLYIGFGDESEQGTQS
ncbi:MAG: HlyD family efflux transporter periplasmic adaptor subunit [Pirellulaceae bacterium]|nr:HlyD family efflux transporter periplasmic adaptor subunit [Pirellulaceae bacterium]